MGIEGCGQRMWWLPVPTPPLTPPPHSVTHNKTEARLSSYMAEQGPPTPAQAGGDKGGGGGGFGSMAGGGLGRGGGGDYAAGTLAFAVCELMDAAGTGGVRTEEILRQLLVAGSIDASTSVHVLRAKLSDLAVEGKVYTSACAVWWGWGMRGAE